MADIVESSAFRTVIGAFASPVVQKIGEVFDLRDHLREIESSLKAQAVVEDDGDFNGGLRLQLRNDVYEAEDFLQSVTVFAATSTDSGDRRGSQGMQDFAFDGVAS